MRLFCAIELPAAVRRTLEQGLAELRRTLPTARWVRAEGIHITLKFLGEQPPSLATQLGATALTALGACTPVEIRLGGAGFFPNPRRPRVAWVGGLAPGLDRWASALEDAAAAHGVPRESRAFSLHLTLARLERPWPEADCQRFVDAVGAWRFAAFTAREVVLFESQLAPGGARYTPLRRWPVGGSDDA